MRVRWIVRGDIDGFFGLALDNLVQLLLIDTLCRTVLGFPPELLYGQVLPAAAISILVGNVAYAFQARALAARTGRTDVCALPYGINTVSLFAHVFLVMLPAKALAERAGAVDPVRVAWQAGLLATFATGVIELGCAFVAERVRKATPRAALLSTLAGIALGFISLGFLFRTFAHPVVGLTTLAIVMLTYFGRVRFKGHLPGGVVAVTLGALLCWITGIAPVGARPSPATIHTPVPVIGDLVAAIGGGHVLPYLSVIIAMGLFNVLGSLQNIESAEAAGDSYDTRYSLTSTASGASRPRSLDPRSRRRSTLSNYTEPVSVSHSFPTRAASIRCSCSRGNHSPAPLRQRIVSGDRHIEESFSQRAAGRNVFLDHHPAPTGPGGDRLRANPRRHTRCDLTVRAVRQGPGMARDPEGFKPHRPPHPPRQPQHGEFLFEFVRERDHTRWRCELRQHPEPDGV